MSRSNVIVLLLACALLSTMVGVVHADGCSLDPNIKHWCVFADKTTYAAGQSISVTVQVFGEFLGGVTGEGFQIYTALAANCSPDSAAACTGTQLGFVLVTVQDNVIGTWKNTETFKLPSTMTAGDYLLVAVAQERCCGVATYGITVTNSAVPESPSVLGLLLSAFLAGIYVLKTRKKLK